jgi:hypothetical protein
LSAAAGPLPAMTSTIKSRGRARGAPAKEVRAKVNKSEQRALFAFFAFSSCVYLLLLYLETIQQEKHNKINALTILPSTPCGASWYFVRGIMVFKVPPRTFFRKSRTLFSQKRGAAFLSLLGGAKKAKEDILQVESARDRRLEFAPHGCPQVGAMAPDACGMVLWRAGRAPATVGFSEPKGGVRPSSHCLLLQSLPTCYT